MSSAQEKPMSWGLRLTLCMAFFLGACGPRPEANVADASLTELVQRQAVDTQSLVAQASEVKKDGSGDYFQIDDMRFRVDPGSAVTVRGVGGQIWPGAALYYRLAPDVRADPSKVAQFQKACQIITQGSAARCIDMDPNGRSPSFVQVINDTGNYSYVGRIGGPQQMGIYNWNNVYVIAHEIKHALGWVHEQSRPDRDKYVAINRENIIAGREHNFDIMPQSSRPSPYDFDSIMHYGPYDFSKNRRPTISAQPGYEIPARSMGQRDHLSAHERDEIILAYGEDGREWCGRYRLARKRPKGCIIDCLSNGGDPANDRPVACGTCGGRGRKLCP